MRKILLVEDEDILRETYATILATQPYFCDVAENGKQALKRCQEKVYDLILLDLMMPVMSGVEFLEQFMKDAPVETRVLIISNLSSGKELDRAMELGAHRSLVKANASPKELLAAIRYELDATYIA